MREPTKYLFCSLLLVKFTSASVLNERFNNATDEESASRAGKFLSVFNVITFPNSACGASNGYNGTCFTASECTSKGGSSSGSCASSFGVCCVFTLSCGGSSSANNSYAIINSYNTASDSDPCTYTFCKTNSDVCKLRIEFTTMVLAGPYTASTTAAVYTDGYAAGDCQTDTLTVTTPNAVSPPVICGYNTGQHMWVPASDLCTTINLDIDTGSTGTTRSWEIKVSQYECGNLAAPDRDCLQWHTASSGTVASFNYDTSVSTVAAGQYHLSNQYYDICIRRASGKCSICFDPNIPGTGTTEAASYGVGASSDGPAQKSAVGTYCTGVTTQSTTIGNQVGKGDYLEIIALQPGTGTSTTVSGIAKLCGNFFNANPAQQTAQGSACTFSTPFKVGVHFDGDEAFAPTAAAVANDLDHAENAAVGTAASGRGYQGFWLNYWQNSC